MQPGTENKKRYYIPFIHFMHKITYKQMIIQNKTITTYIVHLRKPFLQLGGFLLPESFNAFFYNKLLLCPVKKQEYSPTIRSRIYPHLPISLVIHQQGKTHQFSRNFFLEVILILLLLFILNKDTMKQSHLLNVGQHLHIGFSKYFSPVF